MSPEPRVKNIFSPLKMISDYLFFKGREIFIGKQDDHTVGLVGQNHIYVESDHWILGKGQNGENVIF